MDAHPGTDKRFAADPGRADAELPRGEPQRPREAGTDWRFAKRTAILDMIVWNRLAGDLRPASQPHLAWQIMGQFAIGRLAIPFGIEQPLTARPLAWAIGSLAVAGIATVAVHLGNIRGVEQLFV